MRATRVSATDHPSRAGSARTRLLASFIPRFDESISPEFYRLSGKLRAAGNALFLIANLVIAPQVGRLGFDERVHWRAAGVFAVLHVSDLVLGLVLWRRRMPVRAMRRITYACVAIETAAVLFASWIYGSVNSPFLGIALVFILIYRLSFDYKVGLTMFVAILTGLWAVVIAELAGVLPPQPIAPVAVDGVYAAAGRELGAMVYLTIVIVLVFVVAHWAVARIRHKEVAIRLLRESLYAAERGKVGRHTGRTLRDTYAVGSLLGAGGMGEVYTGSHLRTQRKVAIKLLHPHLVEDPTVITRFRREAEITAKLGSDHIVGVIDIDEDDAQPFLVLELMEGESLATRIAQGGPLGLAETADVIDQLARGLAVAHAARIVHRDLKPANIFLCPVRGSTARIVKILDFGVSKIAGNATAITQEVTILGTPDYMSPEQAAGYAEAVETASDIFSLGGVAYTALTGVRPFDAPTVPALLRKICDDDPVSITELCPEVPAPVGSVLAIAMAKRAKDRYASALDFARDLRAAVSGSIDPEVAARAEQLRPVRRGKLPTTSPAAPA